jgi:CheY-like chemotaxis protein
VALARAGANVSFDVALADDLWSADIDFQQTSQALYNILLNARQAMPDGGLIEIKAENFVAEEGSLLLQPGRYVKISVRDYGCGIPPEVLPRVFDPYYSTKVAGSGLGLATAHAVIAKHNGHISVESRVGEGTKFWIYLPASEQAPPEEAAAGKARHSGAGRVLAMDDEKALLDLVTHVLGGAGYRVDCARDGAEAITMFEEAKRVGQGYEVELLDLTVPGGMGGQDAAVRLREIDPSATLIVSSGYSEAPVLANFRTYGFDAALRKPWTAAELTEIVRQFVRSDGRDSPRLS